MIGWLIKTTLWAFRWLIWMTVIAVEITFLMAFNCLTIPVFLAEWAVCKLLKQTTPHITFYGPMAYPTWKHGPHATFMRDVIKMVTIKPRKSTFVVVRPWEARFFD